MSFKNKIWWYLPEYFDRWRVFPRLLIGIYTYLLYQVVTWAMYLPDLSVSQAGVVAAILGVGAAWFQIYVSGAPKMTTSAMEDRVRIEENLAIINSPIDNSHLHESPQWPPNQPERLDS